MYSPTRWWSRFEVIDQVHDSFGDVSFLNGDGLPASSEEMVRILNDPAAFRLS